MKKRQIDSVRFKRLTDSLKEKVLYYKGLELEAMLDGSAIKEQYGRERASAFELALFSVYLNSSVIDEKED